MSLLTDDLLLEQRVRFGELFDLYASLLTEKQRVSFGLMLGGDLSIAELGEELGMTRQGAHDLIKRSRECLEGIERNLGLHRLKQSYEAIVGCIKDNESALPRNFMDEVMGLLSSEEESADV